MKVASEKIFGLEPDLVRMLVVPLLAVLGLGIIGGRIILGKIDEIGQMKKETNLLKQQTRDFDDKRKYLLSIDQNELQRKGELISQAVMGGNDKYYLVNVIRAVADKFGYQIQGFSITVGKVSKEEEKAGVKEKDGVYEVPVTLTLLGPEEKYLELISGLESSLPVLSIKDLEMKSGGGATELALTVASFYYRGEVTEKEIAKMSAGELAMSKKETEVIGKLEGFWQAGKVAGLLKAGEGKFVEYDRGDPFTTRVSGSP